MSIAQMPLESVTEKDLQALVDNGFAERKTIEYKETLPGRSDSERVEFLKDVSSFANAQGGDLLYGIAENNGVPQVVCGLAISDADAECLRLESMIRDSIRPRIFGIAIHPITLASGNIVIVIRIPRSLSAPHMVTYQQYGRFYARGVNGKYQLDVDELRAAFAFSETAAERIRSFRAERLSMIIAGETPAPLADAPKIVLHSFPLGAFALGRRFNVSSLDHSASFASLKPLYGGITHHRPNFDGFLTYTQSAAPNVTEGYIQLFRNGIIEAVDASCVGAWMGQQVSYILSPRFEFGILEALSKYLPVQKRLGAEAPILIIVSLLGVAGYGIETPQNPLRGINVQPIDRDNLLFPEVIVEDLILDSTDILKLDLPTIMKPIFDALWNACGCRRCLNYDEAGVWKPRQPLPPDI